jgi:NADH-quinone oxidoreductase subunit E
MKVEEIDLAPTYDIIHVCNSRGVSLVPVLQQIQKAYGYLPRDALVAVSRGMNIPLARILGTATFYSQFRFSPVGKNVIRVCHGTACHIAGAERLTDIIRDLLGVAESETTADGLFTLERVACLGCCSLAPVVMINDDVHGGLTPDRLTAVVEEYRERG